MPPNTCGCPRRTGPDHSTLAVPTRPPGSPTPNPAPPVSPRDRHCLGAQVEVHGQLEVNDVPKPMKPPGVKEIYTSP